MADAKLTFITTRVPLVLKEKLEALAKRQDKSVSRVIRRILERHVK